MQFYGNFYVHIDNTAYTDAYKIQKTACTSLPDDDHFVVPKRVEDNTIGLCINEKSVHFLFFITYGK